MITANDFWLVVYMRIDELAKLTFSQMHMHGNSLLPYKMPSQNPIKISKNQVTNNPADVIA